jgi:sugar/nucleoside kinase (ribokinase family)
MDGEPELAGIGNALVDVFAAVDEEVGPLLGLHPNRSVHVDYERLSEILVALPDPAIGSGGGAANVVKIAAFLGLSSVFVGRVGSDRQGRPDRFAEIFESELHEAGALPLLTRGSEPTGACAIIRMPGGSVAVAACPSAALGLGADDVSEELIRGVKVLALDGFLLGREALVSRVLQLADRYGTVVALDVGSVELAALHASFIARIARTYPLILFMNEAEAEAFSCAAHDEAACIDHSDDPAGLDERLRPVRALTSEGPFPIIVVKCGPRGALVFAGGDRYDAPTRSAVPYDVTGAGDAFAAGFLSAWIHGKPLADCASLGNRVAREVLAVPGTKMDGERLRRLAKTLR